MLRLIKNFYADESGATVVEYGLIAALVCVSVISGASMMGSTINNTFVELDDAVNTYAGSQ